MSKVAALLSSENQDLTHLALMAITAMSAASPDSDVMLQTIPLLFEASKDSSFGFYPLVCISNLTVDPRNAAACLPYLSELISYIQDGDRISKQRAIVSFRRIITTPEAANVVTTFEIIQAFLQATGSLWNGEHAPLLFDVIVSLTTYPETCPILKSLGMLDIVKERLASCHLNDPIRPKYIRIKARLLAAK